MAQIDTSEFKGGLKVEVEGQPYTIITNEFVKPGKGQAFNRVRLKHLTTGRVIDRTFKSGDKIDLADVAEEQMRLSYIEGSQAVFMCDKTFEQHYVNLDSIGDTAMWLKEEAEYTLIFYNGQIVTVEPPTFMELKITETSPGVRGDTASGRVLKPAVVETGAKVQIPIFVEDGEIIKVDTRTSEYVGRVTK